MVPETGTALISARLRIISFTGHGSPPQIPRRPQQACFAAANRGRPCAAPHRPVNPDSVLKQVALPPLTTAWFLGHESMGVAAEAGPGVNRVKAGGQFLSRSTWPAAP